MNEDFGWHPTDSRHTALGLFAFLGGGGQLCACGRGFWSLCLLAPDDYGLVGLVANGLGFVALWGCGFLRIFLPRNCRERE